MSTESTNAWWPMATAAAVTVAFVGFLAGTRGPGASAAAAATVAAPTVATRPVPRYGDLGETRRGPNAGLYADGLAGLRRRVPDLLAPVVLGDRAAAVRARAERRAYEGAPPVIPHVVPQQDTPACLACHAQGVVIGDKVARVLSHPAYASCVQCHVPAADPRPPAAAAARDPLPPNSFVGLASAGAGARAWPGAPPAMPHGTWMRGDCLSCHGPAGDPGLRTTHPARASCVQCHPPRAGAEARFPWFVPGDDAAGPVLP